MHDTTDFEFYVGSDFKHIIPLMVSRNSLLAYLEFRKRRNA